MKLDLDDIAHFVRITELGSLSAVARERNVPVSQISRSLSRLESGVGARLLHRNTHGLSLTEAGDSFRPHARQMLDARDAMASVIAGGRRGPSGLVRVSVSAGVAISAIVPSLPSLYEAYPDVRIEILAEDRMVDMAREGVDIAVRTGSAHGDNLVAFALAEHGRRVCASPSYLERHGTPTHPDQLRQHRLITNSISPVMNHWPWAPSSENAGKGAFLAEGHTRSDNSAAMLALTLAGVGIARLNDMYTVDHIARGELVPLLEDWFDVGHVPLLAVMLPDRQRMPKVRACVEHWRQWLNRPAPAVAPAPAGE